MAQCPIYTRLRDNPRAITALLRQLRPRRQRGPPREIRQIVDEKSILESGEGSPEITNEAGEGIHDDADTINDNTSVSPIDTLESDFV
jgi:hypothetical protein